jgi:hypothetical protein
VLRRAHPRQLEFHRRHHPPRNFQEKHLLLQPPTRTLFNHRMRCLRYMLPRSNNCFHKNHWTSPQILPKYVPGILYRRWPSFQNRFRRTRAQKEHLTSFSQISGVVLAFVQMFNRLSTVSRLPNALNSIVYGSTHRLSVNRFNEVNNTTC